MSFAIRGRAFDPRIPNDSLAHDGQVAYQIALNPAEASQYLDVPAYRYQRILYPIIARLLSLASPRVLPWTLILVNLIALPLGTVVSETTLTRHGANRWYALTFSRSQRRLSGAAFALASLTREVTLLFPAGYVCYMLRRWKWRDAAPWACLALGPFTGWQIVLRLWLGDWGIGSRGALSTPFDWVPFRGWWKMAFNDLRAFALMSLLVVPLALGPAVVSLVAAVRRLMQEPGLPVTEALLINAVIFPFLSTSNVLDPLGLSRIGAGLVVAVLDYGACVRNRRILNYALLWVLSLAFVYKDSLLPRS
jgi:hypothetical protein